MIIILVDIFIFAIFQNICHSPPDMIDDLPSPQLGLAPYSASAGRRLTVPPQVWSTDTLFPDLASLGSNRPSLEVALSGESKDVDDECLSTDGDLSEVLKMIGPGSILPLSGDK